MSVKTHCCCGSKLVYVMDTSNLQQRGCGELNCTSCSKTSGYCKSIYEAERTFEINHRGGGTGHIPLYGNDGIQTNPIGRR